MHEVAIIVTVDLLVVMIWLELCTTYSCKIVTTISIILSANKIQNEVFLVLAYRVVPEIGC